MEIIVTGGILENGQVTNTTEIIDIESSAKPRKGPLMQIARKGHSQVIMKSGWHVFVCGGSNEQQEFIDSCEIGTRRNNFELLNCKMNIGRYFHGSVCLPNGKIVIFGGTTRPRQLADGTCDRGDASDTYEIFDPEIKLFTLGASRMSIGKTNVGACLMPNGRVFIIGTTVDGNESLEEYDPVTDSFGNSNTDFGVGVFLTSACVFDDVLGKVFLIGSQINAVKTTNTLLYDVNTGQFSDGPKTNITRQRPFLCNFGNGKLVIGGSDEATGKLCICEFLDNKTHKFDTACCLLEYRLFACASKY